MLREQDELERLRKIEENNQVVDDAVKEEDFEMTSFLLDSERKRSNALEEVQTLKR